MDAGGTSAQQQQQQQQHQEASTDRPLVGNLIGEDHANYVLMYNMLTGIRVGVSRCGGKIKRPLTAEDFVARHKYSFDITGNELTPSAKYDFKFKDYAPWVFRFLREDVFNLDPADYLLSLTAKYILSELGSPGKSGSFFYFSRDYRFIIKTIRHSEAKFLLGILQRYYAYATDNPHTLLSRFYGLHRVKLPRGKKIHFVIMNNLFPPHKDIHETYDLKGSTIGRRYPEDDKAVAQNLGAAAPAGVVLKDLNWIDRGKRLELGPEKRALLTEQLRRDAEFLKGVSVMDYSLLVGIHDLQRGNRDKLRRNTLKVFSPNLPDSPHLRRSKTTPQSGPRSAKAIALRRAMMAPSSDHNHTNNPNSNYNPIKKLRLPDEVDRRGGAAGAGAGAGGAGGTDHRHHHHQDFVFFYRDDGGMRATDDGNEPMNVIYYVGVIDILTPWGAMKRVENFWKGVKAGVERHKISPVPPSEYGDRFFSFIKAVMRGGEGGERFKEGYNREKGKEKEEKEGEKKNDDDDDVPPGVPEKEEEGQQQQHQEQVKEECCC